MSQDLEKTLLCDDPVAACAAFRVLHARLRSEIGRVLVGQDAVVEQMLIALFADGHVLPRLRVESPAHEDRLRQDDEGSRSNAGAGVQFTRRRYATKVEEREE